ncbi:hypothetical protein DFH07DRAFT_223521 [Mycena maculata]|uniref:Uncharacterized protein n=1 Tax=Mycena maculata TaxID=230809 RepID=A0AAD7HVL2_9AGAR|nr:hypothetical protein DFH07DRAFT_223521 [Mycena maculata]
MPNLGPPDRVNTQYTRSWPATSRQPSFFQTLFAVLHSRPGWIIPMSPTLLPILAGLLQRQTLLHRDFFRDPTADEFGHPAFSQITQLDFLDLCMQSSCGLLRVLAFVCKHRLILERAITSRQELAIDPRFVLMLVQDYVDDWEKGAHREETYWKRADALVERRPAGPTTSFIEASYE